MLFTLEKLVYKVVKQMQTLLTDDMPHKLYDLYQYEHARGCAWQPSLSRVIASPEWCLSLIPLPASSPTSTYPPGTSAASISGVVAVMLSAFTLHRLSTRMQRQQVRCRRARSLVDTSRPGSSVPCRLPISDATYYANAHVLLHDDHTFRFAYKRNDTATIQMMDPDKTEVSPGALRPHELTELCCGRLCCIPIWCRLYACSQTWREPLP